MKTTEIPSSAKEPKLHPSTPKDIRTTERSKGEKHDENKGSLFSKLAFKLTEYVHEDENQKTQEEKAKEKAKEKKDEVAKLPTVQQQKAKALDVDAVKISEPKTKSDDNLSKTVSPSVDKQIPKGSKIDEIPKLGLGLTESKPEIKEKEVEKAPTKSEQKSHTLQQPQPTTTPKSKKTDESKESEKSANESATASQRKIPSEGLFSRFTSVVSEAIQHKETPHVAKERAVIAEPKRELEKQPVVGDGLFAKLGIFDDEYVEEKTPHEQPIRTMSPVNKGSLRKEVGEDTKMESKVSCDSLHLQEETPTKDWKKEEQNLVETHKADDKIELPFTPSPQHPKHPSDDTRRVGVNKESLTKLKTTALKEQKYSPEKPMPQEEKPKTLLELVKATKVAEKDTALHPEKKSEVQSEQKEKDDSHIKSEVVTNKGLESKVEKSQFPDKLESAVLKQEDDTKETPSLDEKPFVEELLSKLLFLETVQKVSEGNEQVATQQDGANTLERHCVTETYTISEASEDRFIVVNSDDSVLDVSSAILVPDFEKVQSIKTPIVEVNDVRTVLLQQTSGFPQVEEIKEGPFSSAVVFEEHAACIRDVNILTTRPMFLESERETKLKIDGSDVVTSIASSRDLENTPHVKMEGKEYVLEEGTYGLKEVSGSEAELPQNTSRCVGEKTTFREDEESKKVESRKLEKNLEEKENELLSSPIDKAEICDETADENTVPVLQNEQQNGQQQERQLQLQQQKQHGRKLQTSGESDKPKEKPLGRIKFPVELEHDATTSKTKEDINLERKSGSNSGKDNLPRNRNGVSSSEAPALRYPKEIIIHDKEKRSDAKDALRDARDAPPVVKMTNIQGEDVVKDVPRSKHAKTPENKEKSSEVKIVSGKDVACSKPQTLPTPPPVVKKTVAQEKDDVKTVSRSEPRKNQAETQEKPSQNKEEAKPVKEGYFSSFVTKVLASPEVQQFKKTYLQKEEEEEEMDLEEMAEFYAKKNQEARIAQEREASASKDTTISPQDSTAAVDKDESDSTKGRTRKISRQEDSKLAKDQSPRKTSMHSKGTEKSKKRVSFEENVETKMIFSQHNEAKKNAESNGSRPKVVRATPSQSIKEDSKEGTAQAEEGYFSRFVSKILAPSEEEIQLEPLKSEEDDLEEMALFYAKKNEEARKKKEEALMREQKDDATSSKKLPTKEENGVPKTLLKEVEQPKGESVQTKAHEKEIIRKPREDTTKKTEQEAKTLLPKEKGTSQLGLEGGHKESPGFPSEKKETQATNKSYFSSLSGWLAQQTQEPRQTEPPSLNTNDDANLEEMAAYYAKKNAEARSNMVRQQPQLSEKERPGKETEAKESAPKQVNQNKKSQEAPEENKRNEKPLVSRSGISKQDSQPSETRHQAKEKKAKESDPKETGQKGEHKNVREVQAKLLSEETEPRKGEQSQIGEGYLSKFVSRMLQPSESEEVKKPKTQTVAMTEDKKLEEMAAYYAKKNEEARKALQEQQGARVATQVEEDKKEKDPPMKSDSSAKKISNKSTGKLSSEEKTKVQPISSKSTVMASKKTSSEQESKKTQEKSKLPQVDKEKEKETTNSGTECPLESKGNENAQPVETGYLSRFMTKVKSSYDAYQESQPQPVPLKADDEEDLEKMAAFYAKQNQEARMALQKEEEKKQLQGKGSQESENKRTNQQKAPSQQLPQGRKELQTSATLKRKETQDNVKEKTGRVLKPKDAALREKSEDVSKTSDTDQIVKRQKSLTLDQKAKEKTKSGTYTDKPIKKQAAARETKVENPKELPKPTDKSKEEKAAETQKLEKPVQKQKTEKPEDKPKTEKPTDKPPETVTEAVSGLMKWGRSMFK